MNEIILYRYTDRYNIVKKTLPATDGNNRITLTGEFRDAVNIINPQVMITTTDESNLEHILKMNYAYIQHTGRYYFITNIELTRKNLVTISFHVDVLMSHISIIEENTHGYVARNEFSGRSGIPDERLILLPKQDIVDESAMIVTEQFSEYADLIVSFSADVENYNVVFNRYVASINQREMENYVKIRTVPILASKGIAQFRNGYGYNATHYPVAFGLSVMADVLKTIVNNDILADFVSNITVYPFSIPRYDVRAYSLPDVDRLFINDTTVEDADGNEFLDFATLNMLSKGIIVADFNFYKEDNDFLFYEPYSLWEIYLPFYGWKELKYTSLKQHRLIVFYNVCYKDATATVNILDATEQLLIFSAPCELGIKIAKITTNTLEVTDKNNANRLNLSLNLIGSMLAVAGGAVTGNPLVVAGGVLAGTKAIGTAITTEVTNYERGQVQYAGDTTPILSPLDVHLRRTTSKTMYTYDSTFVHENGYVSNRFYNDLLSLRGYTEFATVDIVLDNHIIQYSYLAPTTEEINEIIDYFKKGVYFPNPS